MAGEGANPSPPAADRIRKTGSGKASDPLSASLDRKISLSPDPFPRKSPPPHHHHAMATYDLTIIFRRAENLPIADIGSLSSDPYVSATLVTSFSTHDPDHNPPPRFRTPTERRTTEPVWEWRWDVGGVPRAGSKLCLYVLDEDCRDHDDRLGHVTIEFADLAEWGKGKVDETWYKLRKKGASKKAAVLRLCAASMNAGEGRTARVLVSIEVKGETKLEKEKDVRRAFTRGPSMSPL